MDKTRLEQLLATLRTNEQQAQSQITFIRGRITELEERLARDEKQAYADLGFAQGKITQVEEWLRAEIVDPTSTEEEAELALKEALELHHPAYPSEDEDDS